MILFMQQPKFPVDELRIDIDCTASGSWVEIDAINIVGTTKPGRK